MLDLKVDTTIQTETVDLPHGEMRITELSGLERLELEQAWTAMDAEGAGAVLRMVLLIVWCAIDGEGNRLYGADDVDTIARAQTFEVIERLFNACLKLNHMDTKTVEEMKKNSEPVRAA